jgi:hypothetical protein
MKINKGYIIVGLIIAFGLIFELAAHADERNGATTITFGQSIQVPSPMLPAGPTHSSWPILMSCIPSKRKRNQLTTHDGLSSPTNKQTPTQRILQLATEVFGLALARSAVFT